MLSRSHTRLPYKLAEERGDSAPMHPGEVLREDVLPHYRMTAETVSQKSGVDLRIIKDLLAERRRITSTLAEALGSTLGLEARYWLGLQKQYDLWHSSFGDTKRRRGARHPGLAQHV